MKRASTSKAKKRSKKRVVWSVFWESGCGAGIEEVYERDGLYRYHQIDSGERYGPTSDLKGLLKESGLLTLMGGEVKITALMFSADEITAMLDTPADYDDWRPLVVNDETWVWLDGRWQREEDALRDGVPPPEGGYPCLMDADESEC